MKRSAILSGLAAAVLLVGLAVVPLAQAATYVMGIMLGYINPS